VANCHTSSNFDLDLQCETLAVMYTALADAEENPRKQMPLREKMNPAI
jgi:hypothetical protein